MKRFSLLLAMIMLANLSFAQRKDESKFKEYEPGFYQETILKDVRAVKEKIEEKETHKRFIMDQSGMDIPNKVKYYEREWANPVISQGNAGTCWSYSTLSFIESEIKRIHNKEVKLSEPYIVYWEYVAKARRFVKKRGDSRFTQGSEGNAVTRMMNHHGIIPRDVYNGLLHGREYPTHAAMYKEMKGYLDGVKENEAWNEEQVISTIKSIMNHHIGEPPQKFKFEGKSYTPQSFLNNYLQINPDNFVEILSYKQEPYWQQVEYKVPDNWWNNKDYYNVPLDVFMEVVKEAIRDGYTMSIGGDVSESGFLRSTQAAMIPTFDIPSDYIDEDARQFRFSNKTTTDDHGMHLVGYYEKDGEDWYLIKDSSSGSRNNDPEAPEFGYYFFHEDYVKLKMMNYTIHKDAVKDILKKFN
jgi:bleomycin hydrolase